LDGLHTSVVPAAVLQNEKAAEAWGLMRLKPLECCNGYVRVLLSSQFGLTSSRQTMSMFTRQLPMRLGMLRLLFLLQLW
jgi:hypothetical protein